MRKIKNKSLITNLRWKDLAFFSKPNFIFSPDKKHITTIRKNPEGQFVTLDDKEHQVFDKIYELRFSPNSQRIAYMSDTAALAVQQYFAIRPIQDTVHLFTTQHGVLHPRSLQRRLSHYRKKCGIPVTAQCLRHTFASQMLAASILSTTLPGPRTPGYHHGLR